VLELPFLSRVGVVSFGLIVLFFAFPVSQVRSQQEVTGWVYSIGRTEAEWEVYRTDLSNNITETFITLPTQSRQSIAETLPPDEIAILSDYLSFTGKSHLEQFTLERPLNVEVQNVVVAPDGVQIALDIRYRYCVNPNREICFGVNQIATVSEQDRTLNVHWQAGLNAQEFAPDRCKGSGQTEYYDLQFTEVKWAPDQTAIFVELGGDIYCFPLLTNRPIVVVPLNETDEVVTIGEGLLWTPVDNKTIAAARRVCTNSCVDNLTFFTLDLLSSQVGVAEYSLGTNITFHPYFGMESIGNTLVFVVIDATPLDFLHSIAVFNQTANEPLQLMPIMIPGGVSTLKASPTRNVGIIESLDGSLWLATIAPSTQLLETQLLVQEPVSAWGWSTEGSIVFQPASKTGTTAISISGDIRTEVTVPSEASLVDNNSGQ
jgi:hypothetical protein